MVQWYIPGSLRLTPPYQRGDLVVQTGLAQQENRRSAILPHLLPLYTKKHLSLQRSNLFLKKRNTLLESLNPARFTTPGLKLSSQMEVCRLLKKIARQPTRFGDSSFRDNDLLFHYNRAC